MGIVPSRIASLRLWRSKYAVPAGYALFFLLAFLIFFILTLPVDALLDRLRYEVERNTPYRVDFESADVSSLLAIDLKGVVISRGKEPGVVIDRLHLDPSLYTLLGGRITLPYEARVLGGVARGLIALGAEGRSIEHAHVELRGMDLGEATRTLYRVLGRRESVPILEGELGGAVEIDIDGGARGDFHLTSSQMDVVELKLMGLRLPPLKKLNSSLKGEFVNKSTLVREFSVKGVGFDLELTGTVPTPWMATRRDKIDLRLRLKTNEPRLALLKSLLTKKPDGSSAGRIVGTWSRPRLIRDSSAGRRRIRRPTPRPRGQEKGI